MANKWGYSFFVPCAVILILFIVWNTLTNQTFISNWFERWLLFCAFGGGKSIYVCLWRPYAASFSVILGSLPPAFSDSPLLFGQSLSQEPQSFNSSEVVVLQYVNDIFLCVETEEVVHETQRIFKHSGSLWLQGIKRKDSGLSTIRLIWA